MRNEERQNEEKMQLQNRMQLFYGDYVQLCAQPLGASASASAALRVALA